MWVRFRAGVVGLTRRVVHIVPVPADNEVPDRLTAYCGQPFERGQAELGCLDLSGQLLVG
jgi:hypothetical protein